MTECTVSCPECARTWQHLCADCAHDQAGRHTHSTGHHVDIRINEAPSLHEIREQMVAAAARGLGKWPGW